MYYQGDMEFREFAQFARTRPPQAPTADTQLRTDLKVLSGTRSTRAACSSAFGEAVLQPLTVWRFGAKYFEKALPPSLGFGKDAPRLRGTPTSRSLGWLKALPQTTRLYLDGPP